MDEINRRVLLSAAGVVGAVGVAGIVGRARAGPLNPPAGAITSTGHTVDEIYNRIPVVGGFDGRTPIAGGTASASITQPGSYVLTGNISVSTGSGIVISVPNVSLDLNGFRVQTASTTSPALSMSGANYGVVRNGTLSGGLSCLLVLSSVGVRIEDVTAVNGHFAGMQFNVNTSPGAVIRRCSVYDIGVTTTSSDSGNVVLGINTTGNIGCRVEDCTVMHLMHNGTPPVIIRGIVVSGVGCAIDGCVVCNDTTVAGSQGLLMTTGGVYRNNKVQNFTTLFTGGTDGGGNF